MPVLGWESDFESVAATLHVPPGHKLLAATGVDAAPASWIGRWRVLDFFVLLIVTVATVRLFGRGAGAIALVALVLSYHEPGAPVWTWLNLLAAVALVRVAPPGRLARLARSYRLVSLAVLVLWLVPFAIGQIRIAVYPQLQPEAHRAAPNVGLFEALSGEMEFAPGVGRTGDGPSWTTLPWKRRRASATSSSIPWPSKWTQRPIPAIRMTPWSRRAQRSRTGLGSPTNSNGAGRWTANAPCGS